MVVAVHSALRPGNPAAAAMASAVIGLTKTGPANLPEVRQSIAALGHNGGSLLGNWEIPPGTFLQPR